MIPLEEGRPQNQEGHIILHPQGPIHDNQCMTLTLTSHNMERLTILTHPRRPPQTGRLTTQTWDLLYDPADEGMKS